ncbi:hypothetical protein M422DRAFT_76099 [Sphaerobolus stellatus SS14]|uniref:Aldehyde dehydrogenase domain-containing protein n=1 Tax=Sphaerobolus stellatus (strain SS14) TaxID=990650 RepID=A0A0C9VJE3_SPHS4|nr:hypothetical protein M422DRAFT_76099 [Sphaerobolus stellatus SS14]
MRSHTFLSSCRFVRTTHIRPQILFIRMASNNAFSVLKDPSLVKHQGFIDGKWVDAKGGKTITVRNPATNEVLGTVPEMGVEETKEAIDAAAKAFKTWSKTTSKQRHDILKKLFDLMMKHNDDLGTLIALAAGCTVVIKPPPETPFSALAITELARQAGVPDGVINVVTTLEHVKEVAAELCENKTVRKVTFTGSTAVAKMLYKQGASTMKKVSFEAGGNAPFIVFDDANMDEAIAGVVQGKFRGSGQTCICANRIYVQSGIYDEFAARFAEKVAAFKVGNGLEAGTTHGPLIHERAVQKVESHVKDAVERGANILIGGSRMDSPGFFYPPTVLSDVPADALISKEETFGPLAALIKFKTEEEVIALANDSDVGLAGYFYSQNIKRVWHVAEALEVGMVGVNTPFLSSAYTPFGGVKESGLGREGSHFGLDEYLNIKLIAMGI